ncbi:uncharacterized protein IUM83_17263 [Phytophthora cinnamomi]|uniref:uncharacterized protein n=1 Tax=Phytophthora cinnamomi TaxID=4785 RepID=UPI00355A3E3F|nr:hypothetical protein IUM83_17263 [Phytophthora cinnamomi]
MGWKVARVCGAATEIPQDGARDARDSGSGWVCMTVEDAVVLAGRGDVLRVADAQAFCAGSIETRCAVELPPNVTLAGRNITGARYGVAWGKKQQGDAAASSDICLVDFQAGEVAVKSLPALTEEIVDAYVDARGKQIVAVGGATGKLWGWNPSDCDFNDAEETWEQYGAWVDNDTAFALLLANGQISIGTACDSRSMELLSIATTSTMSKRLSLSALLGKAVTAALQLVWIDQEKQVVVDFGTRRRRVITRLDSGISDLGENEAMNARYRASYRQHYSYHDRSRSLNDEHDSASGIDTLIDLRDNMQRMTQRLRVLETCANSIDEEFKVSQKRLSRMGDHRLDGASAQTRPLDNIDEVLEMTQESHSQAGGRRHKGGLLSKKASSDLTAAKKILETIEQLTISSNDEC